MSSETVPAYVVPTQQPVQYCYVEQPVQYVLQEQPVQYMYAPVETPVQEVPVQEVAVEKPVKETPVKKGCPRYCRWLLPLLCCLLLFAGICGVVLGF